MSFGSYLKTLRRYYKLTQKQLADKIHIAEKYVSNVERGFHKPFAPDTLMRIADILGGDWHTLFRKAGYCTRCKGTGYNHENDTRRTPRKTTKKEPPIP